MDMMVHSSVIAIFTILLLAMTVGCLADNGTISHPNPNTSATSPPVSTTGMNTSHAPQINASQAVSSNASQNTTPLPVQYADQQFLFLMNQYWIPDFYDIKGRIDSSTTFGSDLPQMLNLSADYARVRLKRNINETNGYMLSPQISSLRSSYQKGAQQSITVIDKIMTLNRSDEKFGQEVPTRTAALSLYGTWLGYQTMRCYNLPNMSYPEIAEVPPDMFLQVMGITLP